MPAPQRVRTEIIDPRALDAARREQLVDRTSAIASQIFHGATRHEVATHMVDPPAQRARVILFVDAQGRDVGMQCIQLHVLPVHGRVSHVFRSQAGMLPAWRGGSSTVGLGVREYLRVWLLRPWRPVYYCGVLIHPSSYGLFAHWTGGRLWPSPDRPTPASWLQALSELGQRFGLEQPYPDRPLARRSSFATRESEAEQRYWRQSDKPSARFHLQQVPHRERGEGLLTLVPLGPGFIAGVAVRLLVSRLRLPWPGRGSDKGAGAQAAAQALRRSTFFADLPEPALRALLPLLQWRSLRGGGTLFRQGDAGDALYLVVRGSAYIALGDGASGEQLVDALAPGEVFGEIAVLTGLPRSATVRAAGRLQLLRLGADDLAGLMARHPEFGLRLWQACARRLLRGAAWHHPLLAGLSLDARDARLQAVQCVTLPAGQTLHVGALGQLLRGPVQIEHGDPARQEPATPLALLEAGTRVTALGPEPAVLALLP